MWGGTETDASEAVTWVPWDGEMKPGLQGEPADWDRVPRVRRAGDENGGIRSGLEVVLKLHIHSGKDKKC